MASDLSGLSDRDLLVQIVTKLDMWEDRLSVLEAEVRELRRERDRQSGFLGGARWMVHLATAAPPAVLAWFLGQKA